MNIFASLMQGDSATWLDDPIRLPNGTLADPAGGWTLRYYLRGPVSKDLTATAAVSGGGWSTTLTASDSALLTAGPYGWAAQVSKAGERLTVGRGQTTIERDLAAVSGTHDPRSAAQRALEACEAALATFSASGGKVKSYQIAGRTMEFQTLGEVLQLQKFWALRVATEQAAGQVAQGLGNPRNLYVRFGVPQ